MSKIVKPLFLDDGKLRQMGVDFTLDPSLLDGSTLGRFSTQATYKTGDVVVHDAGLGLALYEAKTDLYPKAFFIGDWTPLGSAVVGEKGDSGLPGAAGADAKYLVLTADSPVFRYQSDGTLAGPDTIAITLNSENVDGVITWSAVGAGAARNGSVDLFPGTGPACILSQGNTYLEIPKTFFEAFRLDNSAHGEPVLTVTATKGAYSDSFQIQRIIDGESSLVGVLTNSNHTTTMDYLAWADSNGDGIADSPFLTGSALSATGGDFKVFRGLQELTNASFAVESITPTGGATVTIDSNGLYEVTSVSTNNVAVVLKATAQNGDIVKKTYTHTVVQSGRQGFIVGNGAPTNSTGRTGDFYLDAQSWTVYGPKGTTSWPPGTSLTSDIADINGLQAALNAKMDNGTDRGTTDLGCFDCVAGGGEVTGNFTAESVSGVGGTLVSKGVVGLKLVRPNLTGAPEATLDLDEQGLTLIAGPEGGKELFIDSTKCEVDGDLECVDLVVHGKIDVLDGNSNVYASGSQGGLVKSGGDVTVDASTGLMTVNVGGGGGGGNVGTTVWKHHANTMCPPIVIDDTVFSVTYGGSTKGYALAQFNIDGSWVRNITPQPGHGSTSTVSSWPYGHSYGWDATWPRMWLDQAETTNSQATIYVGHSGSHVFRILFNRNTKTCALNTWGVHAGGGNAFNSNWQFACTDSSQNFFMGYMVESGGTNGVNYTQVWKMQKGAQNAGFVSGIGGYTYNYVGFKQYMHNLYGVGMDNMMSHLPGSIGHIYCIISGINSTTGRVYLHLKGYVDVMAVYQLNTPVGTGARAWYDSFIASLRPQANQGPSTYRLNYVKSWAIPDDNPRQEGVQNAQYQVQFSPSDGTPLYITRSGHWSSWNYGGSIVIPWQSNWT